jgi:hypothetical protein
MPEFFNKPCAEARRAAVKFAAMLATARPSSSGAQEQVLENPIIDT